MAKPLKVDEVWMDRIAGQLNDMEFGSLHIVVHEGQIVQMERTERKRFENTPSGNAASKSGNTARSSSPRSLRGSNTSAKG
ncbi:YezD family protein [Paenibacillus sp. F6_3S_P_1C]|uniref:YezD family protein n=1 Tax=Paenibacillus vandeheii TaxID=3035917 RepID=A0ABT8JC36_9BACL|nr:YezD family protein [Paenibacillus vandeheii]MDN4602666.1 YezD family protein [Paenibacillus vandeheii]